MHTPAGFSTNFTKSGGGRCSRKSWRGSWRREGSQIKSVSIIRKVELSVGLSIIMSSVLFICFETFLWLLRSPQNKKREKTFRKSTGSGHPTFWASKCFLVSSQFEEKKEIHLTSSHYEQRGKKREMEYRRLQPSSCRATIWMRPGTAKLIYAYITNHFWMKEGGSENKLLRHRSVP